MIGKFVFFGILISAPSAITGLKCFQHTDPQGKGIAPLIQCAAGLDGACLITDGKKQYNSKNVFHLSFYFNPASGPILKSCTPDPGNSIYGCKSKRGKTACFCYTDG